MVKNGSEWVSNREVGVQRDIDPTQLGHAPKATAPAPHNHLIEKKILEFAVTMRERMPYFHENYSNCGAVTTN